jgi:FtsH-binding integral membrane protein
MIISELILFVLSFYIIYCGFGFFLNKITTLRRPLYRFVFRRKANENTFYKKLYGIFFISLGIYGLVVILLFQLHNKFTKFDIKFMHIMLVIFLFISIYLGFINRKKINA